VTISRRDALGTIGTSVTALALAGCGGGSASPSPAPVSSPAPTPTGAPSPGLNALAARGKRRFGSAIASTPGNANAGSIQNPDYTAIIKGECGIVVPENEMKWQAVRPAPTVYAFDRMDEIVRWAQANAIAVRGHTLLWHRPQWFPNWLNTYDFGANPVREAERLLTEHIQTVKLGIEFVNWGQVGDRYFHPFGSYGQDLHGIAFHQLWLREHARSGIAGAGDIGAYSMCTAAARMGRFARPAAAAQSVVREIAYAYHFDAGLYAAYLRRLSERQGVKRIEGQIIKVTGHGATLVGAGADGSAACGRAHVYTVTGSEFIANPALGHEVFGPSSIIVTCTDLAEIAAILAGMEGQLTATLHMAPADYEAARDLLPILENRAGRIIANAWPTGVEVTHAMVHGGPFPATSDGRSTSVGTLAIARFLRPVSYQDLPAALLPKALLDGPSAVLRRVDGVYEA